MSLKGLKNERKPWELPKSSPQSGRKVQTKFYHTTTWRKTRDTYMELRRQHTRDVLNELVSRGETIPEVVANMEPLCEEFEKEGKYRKATVVDHKKRINPENPWDMNGGKFGHPTDFENLQSLSTHKHAVKSAKERHDNGNKN